MEPEAKRQFNQQVIDTALARYGIAPETVGQTQGFESFVFPCSRNGQDCILRISHSRHRPAAQIAGEIDWLNYLARHGVSVCEALPSATGKPFEVLAPEPDYFTATLFRKAPGAEADERTWQPDLYTDIGRMLGRMHALTKRYTPLPSLPARPDWATEVAGIAERFLPAGHNQIIARFNANIERTRALQQSVDNFGLIHSDFHRGNFFVHNKKIHLFDFDDCQHSWFADDIAITLFYAVPHICTSKSDLDNANKFLRCLLEGYQQENTLDPNWRELLPLFLERREIDLYIIIHRSMDTNQLDGFAQGFMTNRRQRIEEGVPYIDLEAITQGY